MLISFNSLLQNEHDPIISNWLLSVWNTLVKELQYLKASSSIIVTVAGIVIVVIGVDLKVAILIDSRELLVPNTTDVKLVQAAKAFLPILVTVDGILILVNGVCSKIYWPKDNSELPDSKVIEVRLVAW